MYSLLRIFSKKAAPAVSTSALVLLAMIATTTVRAADYYVSPGGTASWSECTNINTPCSASTAMNNAVAGDTTHFRGGTYAVAGTPPSYHALLEPANNGTQSSPIVFKAYEGETPVISVNCTASWNQCMVIGTNSKNYITWDGFILTTSNGKTAGAFIGGQSNSTGAVFKNNTIIAGAAKVPNSDNVDITRMENTSRASYINNRVGGLKSVNRAVNTTNNSCLKMYFNDNATISNNEFYDCPTGISAKANLNDSVIRYNYFHDNYINMETHVYNVNIRNSNNNVLDNNIFSSPGYLSLSIQAGDQGMARGWDIHNNTFYASSDSTYAVQVTLGASPELTFYNNIIVGPRGDQFSTGQDTSTLVSMDHNQFGTGPIDIELRRYGNARALYNSLSSWKSSGELIGGGNPGSGALASNPLFMNHSGNMSQILDFQLAIGSPSKGTGRNGADMGANANLVGSSTVAPPKPPTPVTE